MKILFSPMRSDAALTLARQGDTLTVNDTAFDFSELAPGAAHQPTGPQSTWFAGPVTRSASGGLTVPMILPHAAQAPHDILFPAPLEDPPDGPLAVPKAEPAAPDDL